MSELEKLEGKVVDWVDEHLGNNDVLKEVAAPYEAELVKAGEAVISHALLNEIKGRRAQADIDTLVGACEKLLELVEKYVPVEKVEEFAKEELATAEADNAAKAEESGQSVVAAPAESEVVQPDAPAEEPVPEAAPAEAPAEPAEAPAEPAPEA